MQARDMYSDEWDEALPFWKKVDDILEGITELREHSDLYLPQFPAEHPEVYEDRVKSATFYNAYRDTLDSISGLMFRRPPSLGTDVPKRVADDLENCDLQGTHWLVFAQSMFRERVHHGFCAVAVDAPATPVENRAQEIAQGRRPYWVLYEAPSVVNFRFVPISQKRQLQMIVFKECVSIPTGGMGAFMEWEEREMYRVWEIPVAYVSADNITATGPAQWRLYQEVEVNEGEDKGKKELVLVESGITKFDRIPVTLFGEVDDARPFLYDLAEVNLNHFQQQSDFESSLHICGVPIPYAINRDRAEGSTTAWGKSTLIDLQQGGAIGYAEPTGSSLQQMRDYLKDLVGQMRDMGLAIALEGTGTARTATEEIFKAGRRASRLAQLSQQLHDALETLLAMHAAYYSEATGGSVTMGSNGDDLTIDYNELRVLSDMADRGQLRIETVWALMKKAGKLPDDFDISKETEAMKNYNEQILPIAAASQDFGTPTQANTQGGA